MMLPYQYMTFEDAAEEEKKIGGVPGMLLRARPRNADLTFSLLMLVRSQSHG